MKRLEYFAIGSILVLAVLSAGLGARAAWAQTGPGTPTPGGVFSRTITTTGQGQAEAQPDQALVQLGVENDANTASAALTANSTQMRGLLDALQGAGVAAADIQTQQVSLSPRYSNPGQGGGTPELVGYTASNVVQVRVRDLTKLGQMLDSAVRAGGNRIQGIQFVVSDMSQVQAQAREAAWNDAQAKARQLAGLAGTGLGDVLTISESSVTPPRPFESANIAAPQAAAVPVQPGTETIQTTLQVTWALGGPMMQGPAIGTPAATATGAPSLSPGTSTAEPTLEAPGTSGAARTPIAAPPVALAGTATSAAAPLAGPTSGAPGTSSAAGTPIAAPPTSPAISATSAAGPLAGPTSGAPGTSGAARTPIAAPPAGPSASATPVATGTPAQMGITDPFNYCATVGTIDAPDARYTGPKIPSAIASGLQAALNLPGTPAPPTTENSFWRCMNGKVYACTVGANLPCQDKANTSRQPTAEMRQFCTAQPNAAVIPAAVTGHNTIYAWRCAGTTPEIIRQIAQVDEQGFIADVWYEIPPGYQ